MKKVLQFMVTVGGLLAFATVSAQQQPLISYVRPLVGTSGYGNTYPDINTIIKRCWVLA